METETISTTEPLPASPPAASATVSKVFASAPDETRVRRPVDVLALVVATVALALGGWAHLNGSDLERWLTESTESAPEWLRSLSTAVFAASGLAALGIIVLIVRHARWKLVRDTGAALAIVAVAALVLGRWLSDEWPDVLPEITLDGVPSYPVVRLAIAVALLGVVRPSLTAPMRRLAAWIVVLTLVSALIVQYATLSTAVGGFALGLGAGAAVRLWFGTSDGVPTLDRVHAALADFGLDVHDLRYPDAQPSGSLEATGRDTNGEISVRVYGRDAADNAFAERLWRAMWYRDAAWSLGVSRQQLAEHEALLLLLARRAELHVPEVVAVGGTSTGDVVLATRADPARTALGHVPPTRLDDECLDALWNELTRMHRAGLTHGRLDPLTITIADDGRPGFVDLAAGSMTPDAGARRIDTVELLVTTATLVGIERAAAAAIRAADHDRLVDALGTMHRGALSRPLSLRARRAELDVDALRHTMAEALGVEAPEPVDLRRVRWRDVIMLVLALVVANAIIGWITNIDIETLIEEIADASVAWLLVALVVSQLTNVAETVSMMGVVSGKLPFGPTMQFQYSVSYIGLAVPSDAGRIAMTIRYLQKLGVPTRIAVGQGPFTTVFGYVIDALLLLITMRIIGTSLELPEGTDLSGFVTLLSILVVLAVVGVVAVFAVPKLRRRIIPAVKETVTELKGSLTDPRRAAMLIGGLITKKLLFALTMYSILIAFGEPLPLATVVFVNTAVSWFAGVFPVPGGIGVAEAGFVVGLTAFGVPESTALATALCHRLLTTYLPPVVGFFAMKRLERQGFL